MADEKISAMTAATTPLAGTELVPLIQSADNVQTAVSNLTAGRSVSALNYVVTGATVPANGMYLSAANTLAWATNSTLRMTLDANGSLGIGSTSLTGYVVRVGADITGATTARGVSVEPVIQSGVTSEARLVGVIAATAAAAFTLPALYYYRASQGVFGAGSAVTLQAAYNANSNLIGATTNYGFAAFDTAAVTAGKTAYGFWSEVNIATGGGTTWGFYGQGTAPNYFAGDMRFDKTITAAATTGDRTINKNAGSVNFAAAATSLVVTNSRVTANSIVICTVATNDATLTSVQAVPTAGSFTMYANAAATAETRVQFLVIN